MGDNMGEAEMNAAADRSSNVVGRNRLETAGLSAARSRKGHSFLHEYPRIRVDRFTESREKIPTHLRRPSPQKIAEGFGTEANDGPWRDLELGGEDDFFPHPTIQLLTHIHLDHLEGLNSPLYNAAPIYCSHQTKQMLLRLEPGPSRKAGETGALMGTHGRKRPYEWLKLTDHEALIRRRQIGSSAAPRDVLHPLPLNTPTTVEYLPGTKVKLTLLDANHMPGAVMFLVEGRRGAVLHTGDCRAEKWWLDALIRNPVIQRYTSWEEAKAVNGQEEQGESLLLRSQAEQIEASQMGATQLLTQESCGSQVSSSQQDLTFATHTESGSHDLRLRNIYIDDEAISSPEWPMAKKDAVVDLISLMERYPSDTNFFIDLYTWGYEEIYLAIGKTFSKSGTGPRVHVDNYKKKMYAAAEDPILAFLTTKTTTRFHACERKGGCEFLSPDERLAGERDAFESLSQHWSGPAPMPPPAEELAVTPSPLQPQSPLTVYIKPISSSKKAWKTLSEKLHDEIGRANEGKSPYPLWLACPIDRHSTLPELQRFVRAFRPATVTPTTSHTDHYYLAAKYLGPALGPGGQERIIGEAKAAIGIKHWARYEKAFVSRENITTSNGVAEDMRRFKEALRQTLDLSQSPEISGPQYDQGGYDADVSGVPMSLCTSATAATGRLPKQNDLSNRAVAPAPRALHRVQQTDVYTLQEGDSEQSSADMTIAPDPPLAAIDSTTVLSEDLARRYFIVLRMFIEPGLRLKNLPGGIEGPQAWRAVRKLRPDFARRTEEVMHQEVGVVPPPWSRTPRPSAAPSSMALHGGERPEESPSVVPLKEVQVPEPQQSIEQPLHSRSRTEGTVKEAEGEDELCEPVTSTEQAQDGQRVGLVDYDLSDIQEVSTSDAERFGQQVEEEAPTMEEAQREASSKLDHVSKVGEDWLSPLMIKLGSDPLDLEKLPRSGGLATLALHTRVYSSLLDLSILKLNSLSLLAQYAPGLAYTLIRSLRTWSWIVSPLLSKGKQADRMKSDLQELVALGKCTELVARVAALMFCREVRDSIDDGVRTGLLKSITSTYELTVGMERQYPLVPGGVGEGGKAVLFASNARSGPSAVASSDHRYHEGDWQYSLKRVVATLRFAMDENEAK